MNNEQADSHSWEVDQGNVANPEDCPLYTTTIPSIIKLDRQPNSAVDQKSLQQDMKQKVPLTLKYQLHIRKNSQRSPDDIPTPSPPPGAHSGQLQELTFDQGKGQFLWASESYQGNLKKRRMGDSSSPTSLKPYNKVPRPPNAFIIYHKTKSKELSKFKSKARSAPEERHPSKTVAEMWREEPEEIKLYYQREADLALVEHKKKYPYYKYNPKKKKESKSKGNSTTSSSSTGSVKGWYLGNPKEDSQVPVEHRKQASMESAFTVFDLQASSDGQEDKEAAATTPKTPIWSDFSVSEELNLSHLLPEQQQQQQCPNCHHPKSWSQLSQITPITTPEATYPLMAHEQTLSFIPEYQTFAPSLATHVLENSLTPSFSETDFPQFSDDISSSNEISIPTIATAAPDILALILNLNNWSSNGDLAGYVVPSQETQTSSITLPPATLQELPPTPTSPVDVYSYAPTPAIVQCADPQQPFQQLQQLLQLHPNFTKENDII